MIDAETLRVASTRRIFYGETEEELRAEISGLYYSLFHRLAWAGADLIAPDNDMLRQQIARSYDHSAMAKVCRAYKVSPQPNSTASIDRLVPIRHPFIVSVCNEFTPLQEQRHRADYDLSATITPDEADEAWASSERAHAAWSTVEGSPDARVFLTALLLQDKWSRRG